MRASNPQVERPEFTDLLVAASKKEGYLVPAEVLDAATAAHCDVLNLGAWACAGAASVVPEAAGRRVSHSERGRRGQRAAGETSIPDAEVAAPR